MGLEMLAYPFLFISIFFEAFLLVTFLSKPARDRRQVRERSLVTPRVAVVVPMWNEETTVTGTIQSLLTLDYPKEKLSIILVNDGSTDGTAALVDRFAAHPQITAIHKQQNEGKFTAMNIGIEHAKDADLIGFLDADSFVAPDALREIASAFENPMVAAVTASMSIHAPQTIFQRMQYAEYIFAITCRHIFASINGLYVTPGPFSFYRRSVFVEIGLFKHAYLAEDMEMALRMQRAGLLIDNALRARVHTKGPPTLKRLFKQRVRWTTGLFRNVLFDYRDLFGSHKNPVIGMLVLPLGFIGIIGGISLFITSIVYYIARGLHTLSMMQTVPFPYLFSWPSFNWFYLPLTWVTLLGLILAVGTVSCMAAGKYMSKTPGNFSLNVCICLLLYSFVTPLWLMYSVSDVARGARTPWR